MKPHNRGRAREPLFSTLAETALLFASALCAGAVNSIAGGGSLLTFPALLAVGVTPLGANATSTVALVPGSFSALWGYREHMRGEKSLIIAMALPSLVGGALGALLALHTGNALFGRLVPWLIFGATGLFALQGPISRRIERARENQSPKTLSEKNKRSTLALALFQFPVALYGGFFGAGIGILMLAAITLQGERDIHRANGLKNLAAVCINGVATVTFILSGEVSWTRAAVMALGAVAGGWGGAGVAKKLGQTTVRTIVLFVGFGLAALMFLERFG